MKKTILISLTIWLLCGIPSHCDAASLVTGEPCDYVIIAPGAWTSALDYYVARKAEEGYSPRVFGVEDIYANYSGTEQCEKILNFIKDAFNVWNISYLLLVGEIDDIPSGPPRDGFIEQDNYYVFLDGDADWYQDAYIGRLPADNYGEASAISAKWADYDTHGWGRSEFSLTGEAVNIASANNDFDNYNWQVKEVWGGNVFNTIQPEDIIAEMNSGHGLINWVGHGMPYDWVVELVEFAGDEGFAYDYQDAYNMTNTNRLSFINAIISCQTGIFSAQQLSIAQSFIKAPSGGAIGYIGANRAVSVTGPSQYCLSRFYGNVRDQYLRTGHVMPGVAFHDALTPGTIFTYNLLGDPTAKMDLLPEPPDTLAPQVSNIQLSANNILPAQVTTISAQVTDDDCVGIVTAEITMPDATLLEKEMAYDRTAGLYTTLLLFSQTTQEGLYQIQIAARDISQNESILAGPDLTVLPDVEAPVITDATITPQIAYQNQMIEIVVLATDNAGFWGLDIWAEVTKPDGSAATLNQYDLNWFTGTDQPGTYNIIVYAEDYSGNQAIPYPTGFEVLLDTEPPTIQDYWVSDVWCDPVNIVKITSIDIPGEMIILYVTATDNASSYNLLTTWAELTKPDLTVEKVDFWWMGYSWETVYSNSTIETEQIGTYSIVYYAQDQSGNTAQSDPLYFHVGVNAVNTFTVDDFNDWDQGRNSLGLWTGGNPARMYETTTANYDGTKYRKFYYGNNNWYASILWDNTTYLDISAYNYLTFAIKGDQGGESFRLELQYGTNSTTSVNLSNTTTQWQEISIPLSSFTGLDKTRLRAVSIVFQNSGTIYMDNLEFANTGTSMNLSPVVSDIPDQIITGGGTFASITLDGCVDDPDNSDSEITWSASGNSALLVNIDAVTRVATVSTPSPSWTGQETITFRATDPGGEFDEDAAVFTVSPLTPSTLIIDDYNDWNVGQNSLGYWTGGNLARMQETTTANYDGTKYRKFYYGNNNWYASILWDNTTYLDISAYNYLTFAIKGDQGGESFRLELQCGTNSTTSVNLSNTTTQWQEISIPLSSFTGLDKTRLRAVSIVFQNSGTIYMDNLVFTTNPLSPVNQPPVVSDIPDQTITEGQTFASITLDGCVADPDNTDSEITWTATGNSSLTVTIDSVTQVATVTTPSPSWSGQETITFRATDPGGELDEDAAVFTVNPLPVIIYTITAGAGTGGGINPTGDVLVNQGEDQTFTITANTGYSISDVLVDGILQGAISSYAFNTVTSDHTIMAAFTLNNRVPDISLIPDILNKTEGDTLTAAEIELATDPDGDTLTYTYSGWLTSLPYTTTNGDAGNHTLHVDVSDGTLTAGKDITVTVNPDEPTVETSIIVDHNDIDITALSEEEIQNVKLKLHIGYGHTSHGSQVTNGYNDPGFVELNSFANNGGLGLTLSDNIFSFSHGGSGGALDMCHNTYHFGSASDLGNPDRTTWANETRNFLDNVYPQTNVIMWSWCGQASSATEADMDLYLSLMNQLEMDYPEVQFVHMTGHLDGTGPQGNLHIRNEQIREYCRSNNKILYDFADIESYDPEGLVNYMELNANDGCYYDSDGNGSRESNWAIDWQNTHTEGVDWYSSSAAHSQPINANMKAYAAWALWAKIAAHMDGSTPPATYTITATQGTGGSVTPSGNITVTEGQNQSFTITQNSGYSISDVLVDGVSQGNISSYTFNNVTSDHTIAASFAIVNQMPISVILANPASGQTPLTVNFDASTSSDADGSITGYSWDFDGNGTEDSTAVTASHTYTVAGTYIVLLTVTDNDGDAGIDTAVITVSPLTSSTLIVDDYDDWNVGQNSLGYWTGGNPARMQETTTSNYDGTKCRKFYYYNNNWYASILWNNTTYLDISAYNYLTFAIKGDQGGESFRLELQYGTNSTTSVNLSNTTTEWQEISVPLSGFAGLDKTRLRAVSIVFQNSGTIYMDNLEFTTGN